MSASTKTQLLAAMQHNWQEISAEFGDLPFTELARQAFLQGGTHALTTRDFYGDDHLIYGLCQTGGAAISVLQSQGIDIETLMNRADDFERNPIQTNPSEFKFWSLPVTGPAAVRFARAHSRQVI